MAGGNLPARPGNLQTNELIIFQCNDGLRTGAEEALQVARDFFYQGSRDLLREFPLFVEEQVMEHLRGLRTTLLIGQLFPGKPCFCLGSGEAGRRVGGAVGGKPAFGDC